MLDIEQADALIAYLRERGDFVGEAVPAVEVLEGGVSNRTVLVTFADGRAWVLKQALEKLRVSVDWYSSPARIHREALGLRWLRALAPDGTIPGFIFEDDEQHILAMEAIPQPHANWKRLLLAGAYQPDHVRQFAYLLATIHREAWLRRAELAPIFEEYDFFETLRIEPYYLYVADRVAEAADFLRALVDETRAARLTLVHGDYSPKNILVHQDGLILLDHEVIHWGDPAFDVGFSLTHLLSKAHHLVHLRPQLRQGALAYWGLYRETLGAVAWFDALEARAVRQTLTCLLARVVGRSPLEYLSSGERERQYSAALALIQAPPAHMDDLIHTFIDRIEHAHH
jgi:hypothetical protein